MTGRVVALDHGSARCGVAVSDPTGTLATPLEPILRPNTRKGFNRLLADDPGDRARHRRRRAARCPFPDATRPRPGRPARSPSGSPPTSTIPVELYDERFTTALAQRRPGIAAEDSRAAAVLLEDWLAARR